MGRSGAGRVGPGVRGHRRQRPCAAPPCRTPPPSPRTCSSRPGPRTGGCPRRPTASRSPTAPIPASSRCWRRPRPATGPASASVAGIAAAWFFGNNPAGEAMYDPATGRTYDGVAGDGVVNRNSGAESTIHGLLAMLILDGEPDIAASRPGRRRRRSSDVDAGGSRVGRARVGCRRLRPADAWTGESLWSGGAGVRLSPGGTLTIAVAGIAADRTCCCRSCCSTRRRAGRRGRHRVAWRASSATARVGPQGDSPAPGLLAVETLPRTVNDVESVVVRGSRADDASSMPCSSNPRSNMSC